MALAFVLDYSLHRFIFPQTMSSAGAAKNDAVPVAEDSSSTAGAATADSDSEGDEEVPPNPKGLSVKDASGKDVPVNTKHEVGGSQEAPTPPQPKKRARRKGNFGHIRVHILMW